MAAGGDSGQRQEIPANGVQEEAAGVDQDLAALFRGAIGDAVHLQAVGKLIPHAVLIRGTGRAERFRRVPTQGRVGRAREAGDKLRGALLRACMGSVLSPPPLATSPLPPPFILIVI